MVFPCSHPYAGLEPCVVVLLPRGGKEFMSFDLKKNYPQNWFQGELVKKVGKGRHTSFWEDPYIRDISLNDRFPRLFYISQA